MKSRRVTITTALDGALQFHKLRGREALHQLFEFDIDLLGNSNAIDPKQLLGKTATVAIETESGDVRYLCGIATGFRLTEEDARQSFYRMRLRPWLWLATLRSDFRIFQGKSVPAILEEVLGRYGHPIEKRLSREYRTWDYCVQYHESDFAFVSRLCEHEGIHYYFKHEAQQHTLVFADEISASHDPLSGGESVRFHPLEKAGMTGGLEPNERIYEWQGGEEVRTGTYFTNEFDPLKPRADLASQAQMPPGHAQDSHEDYEWPGGYTELHDGEAYARVRMEELLSARQAASGRSNRRDLAPGRIFELASHPRADQNQKYLLIQVDYDLQENLQASEGPGGEGSVQRFAFEAQPVTYAWRPSRTTPKPRTRGPQTAIVVGPAGEEIWTDAYGRVKLQFHWDRKGRHDENSSCWVRASMSWAGPNFGEAVLPRIGQEVIVDFLNGDPDYPIITGRVFNAENMPAWSLPGQKNLSGLRSRELGAGADSAGGGRSNHLVLDDLAGKIQAQLKSDHMSSSLSLGHVARVEDTAGRKDERGEGFELRSDGWGAMRSAKGLLISTDGRSNAVGGLLSRDELVGCLELALSIAKDLAKAADKCEAGTRETGAQQALSEAAESLGHGASNEANARGKAPGGQAVLALSGAAGIASATPKDHTQYAGLNIDTVAGHSQQHYADQSILHTAGKDIGQFARTGDIRVIANEGKLIHQAQHNSVEITGEKSITIQSTEDSIVIKAKKSITLALEDGTYLRMGGGRVVWGMTGEYLVQTANYRVNGPSTIGVDFPSFLRTDQAQQLKLHRAGDKKDGLANRAYSIAKGSGGKNPAETGGDAISKLEKDKPFDIT